MEKENKKTIEIPFGAKDSELYKFEYSIPEGYEAEIKDGKVIVKKKESKDERIRKELLEEIEFIIPHDDETDSEGLILPSYHARIDRYKSYLEKQKEQKPVKLNDNTEVGIDRALQIVRAAKGNLYGYQSDDGIYECDHAIQTLERILKSGIEQKPAEWGEEDKAAINNIVLWLSGSFISEGARRDCLKWFNEHRRDFLNLPHWKPSEEQMHVLKEAILYFGNSWVSHKQEVLESIYNGLKKL